MRHATHVGLQPEIIDPFLAPWRGAAGQVAFYRQYSQIRQAEGELRFDGQREDRLYGVLGATEAPVHAAPRCLRSSSS
jgi:hypothetical protein